MTLICCYNFLKSDWWKSNQLRFTGYSPGGANLFCTIDESNVHIRVSNKMLLKCVKNHRNQSQHFKEVSNETEASIFRTTLYSSCYTRCSKLSSNGARFSCLQFKMFVYPNTDQQQLVSVREYWRHCIVFTLIFSYYDEDWISSRLLLQFFFRIHIVVDDINFSLQ